MISFPLLTPLLVALLVYLLFLNFSAIQAGQEDDFVTNESEALLSATGKTGTTGFFEFVGSVLGVDQPHRNPLTTWWFWLLEAFIICAFCVPSIIYCLCTWEADEIKIPPSAKRRHR